MNSRVERFKKRQQIKEKVASQPFDAIPRVVSQDKVDRMLRQGLDEARVERLQYTTAITYSLDVDPQEASVLLEGLREKFDHECFEKLVSETRRDVMLAIAGPFGLGKILAAYDKNGGNVTTVHNAQQGVYAHAHDKYDRYSYDRAKNSEGKQFAGAGKKSVGASYTQSKMDSESMVHDEYTGKLQKADTTSPDHIQSLSDFHKDGGFMLASERKADFATDTGNLALTDRSVNQSMQDAGKEIWMAKQSKKDKELSNAEYYEVDKKAVKAAVERGHQAAKKYLPSNKEKAVYYAKNATRTGVGEGAKMGLQQALGLLMVEFFSQVFHEAELAFKNGLEGNSLIDDLKARFNRIAKKIAEKWKDVASAFSSGFFSGFISNLVTVAINIVKTTSARTVRLIREGVFSLFKALKMLLLKPSEMSRAQAMHEALKIIFAGGIVIAGVALEESVSNLIVAVPFLVPFASILTVAIVGALSALAAALVAYLIDKLDLFGAIRIEQNKFIAGRLDGDIQESLKRCEAVAEAMDQYLLI